MGFFLLVLLALAVAVRYGAFGDRLAAIMARGARTGVLLGGIGFLLGFVGPMILAPDANQGTMLGIFITGPLGFLLGLVWGAGREWLKQRTGHGRAG